MAEPLQIDDLITLPIAAKLLPHRVSVKTLYRWCTNGRAGRNGERIFLACEWHGRQIYVTPSAIREFGRALAIAKQRKPGSPRRRRIERSKNNVKHKAVIAAKKSLDAHNI
jgi:hypothetical protein